MSAKSGRRRSKELRQARKEARALEKEHELVLQVRDNMTLELRAEAELLDAVRGMVAGYKKQLNEVRRDKERLAVQLKLSAKQADLLRARCDAARYDGDRLLQDFHGALQAE